MRIRLALVLCTLSVAAMTAQTSDMRTRAEITNYEETSTYADVTRVIDGLVATSKLVHTESFGKTEEGRDLPLMVISIRRSPRRRRRASWAGRSCSCRPTSTPAKWKARKRC